MAMDGVQGSRRQLDHIEDGMESVKLGVWMEMLGLKLCEVLASTCRLHRSLGGCLKFWRSRRSRRVQSRAEKKLKEGESKLREVGC